MNGTEQKFPLAPFDRSIRIGNWSLPSGVLFAGCGMVWVILAEGAPWTLLWLLLPVAALVPAIWACSPRAVRVTPEGVVVVRRRVSPLLFPWQDFSAARRLERWRGWKTAGSAGFFGYFGRFYLPGVGGARVYATTRLDAVVFAGRPPVVVTVADTTAFLAAVRRYLPVAA